jgi:hypothetical protein
MKIRTDFVTNSSSSSYLVIGVTDQGLIEQLFEKLWSEKNMDDYDGDQKFSPSYGCQMLKNNYVAIGTWEEEFPYVIGKLLGEGERTFKEAILETMTLSQARELVAEQMTKDTGIEIKPSYLKLWFGEAGND